MILAAGFGTRLLPHSALKPKPLFPILGAPLLLATIARLQAAGFDHILVNAHHLRGQIGAALAGLPGVALIEEERILGTGGGLRGALPFLRDEPLLVTNGDIYHLLDFAEIYQAHCRADAPVTMVMRDFPRFNTVTTANGRVISFDRPECRGNLAFTGLHVINPQILSALQPGVFSSIIDLYRQMLAQEKAIRCHDASGVFWTDMGTEADYLALHEKLLSGKIQRWRQLPQPVGARLIARDAHIGANCRLDDWLAIGAATITGGAALARVVVWDDVEIYGGVCRDCLISENTRVKNA
jgi:mannose-1-phosphate guanylyltransferase